MNRRFGVLRALAVIAVVVAGGPTLAVAQGQPAAGGDAKLPVLGGAQPSAAPAPSWSSVCQGAARSAVLECQMEQRAVLSNTGQLVGSITIRVPSDTRKPVLMIRGPLGVTLAAGVTIDVDGSNAVKLPLQTCDNGGCYAGAPVADDLLAAMFKGQKLNMTFANLKQEQIKLPLSLAGFSATYAKIK